ncbi:MAG: M15 family metallopeptidase [Eubacteriales bacterium]|nr:M15 family metallopeptidase [Eubacteriales bacterium]
MFSKLLALIFMSLSLGNFSWHAASKEVSLGGNLFLVNRAYTLDSTYVPQDLIKPDVLLTNEDITMRREAAQALKELFDAAKIEQGMTLHAISGYRSYYTQKAIFNRKLNSVGSVARAQKYVAPAGTSEHQLGLAMDIGTPKKSGLTSSFGETVEGQWVAKNAHRFGYIIRYKEGWEEITGYNYEPWHIRYVGKEHAQKIFEQDIPLEYYVEQLIKDKLQSNPDLYEVLSE